MATESDRKLPLSQSFVRAYEATQVELRGQFSVERLLLLQDYIDRTSIHRVLAVIILTPLPCLALTSLLEAIPLAPPKEGLAHSHAFWVRAFLSMFLMTWCQFDQCRRLVVNLPFTPSSVARVSFVITAGTIAIAIGISYLIGFPLPFALPMMLPGWFVLSGIYFFVAFGQLIRLNDEIRRELWLVGGHLLLQGTMSMIYPAVGFVFASSTSHIQSVFALLLLPVLKLVTKNVMRYSLHHKEDFLPEVVILNVEIFHAFFVCTCMQSAGSFVSIAIIMAVDALQSVLSIRDVSHLTLTLTRFCDKIPSCSQMQRVSTGELIAYILSTSAGTSDTSMIRIRSDATLASSLRAVRRDQSFGPWTRPCCTRSPKVIDGRIVAIQQARPANPSGPQRNVLSSILPFEGQKPQHIDAEGLTSAHSRLTADDRAHIDSLSAQVKLQFVCLVLRLFHRTEFLLLIEFTEVVVPMIYGAFLAVVFHLPNRVFYRQLKNWGLHQLELTIGTIFTYASLELLSFLALALLLRRRLRMSSLHQLAFVLES